MYARSAQRARRRNHFAGQMLAALTISGVLAGGAYLATSIGITATGGTTQQAGMTFEVPTDVACQASPLVVSPVWSAPLEPDSGFEPTVTQYRVSGVQPDCVGNELSIGVNLASAGGFRLLTEALVLIPGQETYYIAAGDLVPTSREDILGVSAVVGTPPIPQTITFTALPDRYMTDGNFTIAPKASSGLVVTVTSTTPATCTVSGNSVTLQASGTCTLRAVQPGSSKYEAAAPVEQSFTISRVTQVITFDALADRNINTVSFTAAATTTSGLPVTFTSLTPSVCTSSGTNGSLIRMVNTTTATCTVRASQAGNNSYAPADSVERSFFAFTNPPQVATATVSGTSATWTPVTEAVQYYVVYRRAGTTNSWVVYATGPGANISSVALNNPGTKGVCSASNKTLGFTTCAMSYGWTKGVNYEFGVYTRNKWNLTSRVPIVRKFTYIVP